MARSFIDRLIYFITPKPEGYKKVKNPPKTALQKMMHPFDARQEQYNIWGRYHKSKRRNPSRGSPQGAKCAQHSFSAKPRFSSYSDSSSPISSFEAKDKQPKFLGSPKLLQELKRLKVKFTEKDLVFITKDKTGQIVWLEKGNASAGLEHILNGDGKTRGHALDFEKTFGMSREKIPACLHKVVSEGTVVSNKIKIKKGREGYERVYYYDGKHYVLTALGTNGFIVSAYPVEY